MIQLREYQVRALAQARAAFAAGSKRVVLVSPTGCHAAGQGILMFDGSIQPVESIQVGDQLMGPDSQPREVLQLCRGVGPMYKIEPVKGRPFIVNDEHILTLVRTATGKDNKSGEVVDVSVREWLTWPKSRKHIFKLFRVPVEFAHHSLLTIDPYFLGVLIGDGCTIRSVSVCKPDEAVINEVYRQAAGHDLRVRVEERGTSTAYFMVGQRGFENPIATKLKGLGLFGVHSIRKSIPKQYLTATREDRLQLLAGLLDTDGHLATGGYDWISGSEQLADDMLFLARSLGFAAYMRPARKSNQYGPAGIYFRVSISGETSEIPCRIPRKIATKRAQKKSVLRTGFTATPVGEDNFFGFTLTGDGRYLLDDFTVTHNSGKTILASSICHSHTQRPGSHVVWLAHRSELVAQAARALRSFGLRVATIGGAVDTSETNPHVTVCTIQTLLKRAKPRASLLIWDECHHAPSDEWSALVEAYQRTLTIGLTATPERQDGRGLGSTMRGLKLFDALVEVASIRELTELGHLVPCDVSAPLKKLGANTIAQHPVDAYLEHARGTRALIFARTVAKANEYVADARARGLRAAAVHGKLDVSVRAQILRDHDAGKLDIICNCHVLTEGYDSPSLQTVILARGCSSPATYLQIVGRALRPSPGKRAALLIDLVGVSNDDALGKPDKDRVWELDGGFVKKKETDEFRFCPVCGHDIGKGAISCDVCGWEATGADLELRISKDPLVLQASKFGKYWIDDARARATRLAKFIREVPADAPDYTKKLKGTVRRYLGTYQQQIPTDEITDLACELAGMPERRSMLRNYTRWLTTEQNKTHATP